MTALRHAKTVCSECPWRRDTPLGRFPPERYESLRSTSRQPDEHGGFDAPMCSPMFACHKSAEGKEIACAGWLAVEGYHHLGVRLALMDGRLNPDVLEPGPDWPELYGNFGEMAEANGCPL